MEGYKVILLGYKGMLGNYIYKYFKNNGIDIVGLTREEIDARFMTKELIENVINKYIDHDKKIVIINTIGLIKPSKASVTDYIRVNSLFPHQLETVCLKNKWKLIHPSTDCVFGNRGKYSELDIPDADDVYGNSKLAGEPIYSTVIRVSIIGEELTHKYSLLEWIKSTDNCKGFTNHIWNGISCLEYAKIMKYIIENNLFWEGPRHLFSPTPIIKYDLIKIISEIYNLNITIEPFETKEPCDKTLTSIYDLPYKIPELKEQIEEMKDFGL